MKFVLATAALASLLLVGGVARAEGADDPGEVASVPVGRCLEVPMSQAIAMAEREANRLPASQSIMSSEQVSSLLSPPPSSGAPRAAAPALPLTRMVQVCISPDSPGCRVSAPPVPPARVQLEHAYHGYMLAPAAAQVPPAVVIAAYDPPAPSGGPRSAVAPTPWRPPAA